MADYERITDPTCDPVDLEQVKDFIRQDLDDEDTTISHLVRSAVVEIENFASIAMLNQSIKAQLNGPFGAGRYALPVGPVTTDASVTVAMLEPDGTITALDQNLWSIAQGRAPAIWIVDDATLPDLLSEETTTLIVTYTAGFGDDDRDVPADLRHAVLDQVAVTYENRGPNKLSRHQPSMSPHMLRIAQRYKRVTI
ncbi:MAG: hypothetical protein AAF198_13680 [Pseudomonadota bacterium]